MVRFIMVTFLILGWGFYELSGGSDFTPPEVEVRPLNALLESVEEEESSIVARADTAAQPFVIVTPAPNAPEAVITPASFAAPVPEAPAAVISALPEATEEIGEAEIVEAATVAPPQVELREVTGTRVNMRTGPGTTYAVLGQLVRGDIAEVIEDPGTGWVQIRVLETGAVGWMSAGLMTALN